VSGSPACGGLTYRPFALRYRRATPRDRSRANGYASFQMLRQWIPRSPREPFNFPPVSPNHRLLFLATPSFDLEFRSKCFFAGWKCLLKYEFHRSPSTGIARNLTGLVFCDTFLKVFSMARVIGAISATENINPKWHGVLQEGSCFDTSA